MCICYNGFDLRKESLLDTNYDETKVPDYSLPNPLVMADGTPVRNAKDWFEKRRSEILTLFEREMFGKMLGRPAGMWTKEVTPTTLALNGSAFRKEVVINFNQQSNGPTLRLLMYLPVNPVQGVPVFLGLNFNGNQAIHSDPEIKLSGIWTDEDGGGLVNKPASETSRGSEASRWQVEQVLARGYALATAYYGDLTPDYNDSFQYGIHPLFYHPGQPHPAPDEWGAIGAWAWGLSRVLDYLETNPAVDASQVAVMGHSRLGKAALWAGAVDQRFAMVISNNSGCAGAALSRRCFGETVEQINNRFPYWFCANFHSYNHREASLPFDQHELLALIAPRPVYVASASEDLWADPHGEFLSVYHASPVYHLLGKNGIETSEMPALEQPVMNTVGYHIRSGAHDVTSFDWQHFMDFADLHFHK